MTTKKTIVACLMALSIGASLFVALPLGAQSGEKYKVRLAPAPPLNMRGERGSAFPTPASYVAGLGEASATLSGKKLTVTGKFDKMASQPTEAKVGLGLATGARSANPLDFILDLKLTKSPAATPPGTSGTIEGTFDLTPAQVDGLKKGKLYIQINSESAPKGHLLGWLLK